MSERESDRLELVAPTIVPVDDETRRLLEQAIRFAHGVGGERELRHVIRLLRRDSRGAATSVGRWIEAASDDPMLRWSLMYVISELEDAACLAILEREALRQLPRRLRQPGVCEQEADYEELVAVMAIEGLVRLAAQGNSGAVEVLLRVVTRQDRRSIRRPAAVGLISVRPELRPRVAQMLPDGEGYVLELRQATPQDLRITITDDDLRRNPNRREARPKPAL